MSCNGGAACRDANIGHVVGPSCTGDGSCRGATIGSVDLINSCNKVRACKEANGNEAFDELIDCCNVVLQCKSKDGLDIVNAGCVSYMCI